MEVIKFTYKEYLCNAEVTTRDSDEVIYVFENEKNGLTYIAKHNDGYYYGDCDMNGRTDLSAISDRDLIITKRGTARICTHAIPNEPIVITYKSFADLTEDVKKGENLNLLWTGLKCLSLGANNLIPFIIRHRSCNPSFNNFIGCGLRT